MPRDRAPARGAGPGPGAPVLTGRLRASHVACHLPDGGAAMAASALRVFADDLAWHADHGPCPGAAHPPVVPVPAPGLGR
jgi:hypothetical protein